MIHIGPITTSWWQHSLNRNDGEARTARAQLRRCVSPAETLAVSETHFLNSKLIEKGYNPSPDQLALLSTIFSRLDGVNGEKLAFQFGKKTSKDGPRVLSELRFQSLIRIHSRRELIVPLRRALAILGTNPTCNGVDLANDLFFWNDDVRNKWCFEYFGTTLTNPDQKDNIQ